MKNDILNKLKALSNPKAVEGMARYGINPENTYGISIPNLRKIARETGQTMLSLRNSGLQVSTKGGYWPA